MSYQSAQGRPVWPMVFAEGDFDGDRDVDLDNLIYYLKFYTDQDAAHTRNTVRDYGFPNPLDL